MPQYIGNPKKEKSHILIYAGNYSGSTNSKSELVDQSIYPSLALSTFSKLEKLGKNVILHNGNDNVYYQTLKKLIFISDSKEISYDSMIKKAIQKKVPFIIIANDTEIENYCSSLNQKDFSD